MSVIYNSVLHSVSTHYTVCDTVKMELYQMDPSVNRTTLGKMESHNIELKASTKKRYSSCNKNKSHCYVISIRFEKKCSLSVYV